MLAVLCYAIIILSDPLMAFMYSICICNIHQINCVIVRSFIVLFTSPVSVTRAKRVVRFTNVTLKRRYASINDLAIEESDRKFE